MEGIIVVVVLIIGFVMMAICGMAIKEVKKEWRNKDRE